MKMLLTLILFTLPIQQAFSQEASPEGLKTPAVLEMDGSIFCVQYGTEFAQTCKENLGTESIVNMNLTPQNPTSQRKWTLRLYFGNGNTFYDPTDMTIKTSRLNITMKDVKGVQRSGYQYLQVWKMPLKDSMRWVDEPTNNLKVVFDKNKHQFFLMINHPKIVYVNGHGNPGLNSNIHVTGTVDGVYQDAMMPLNPQFDGYNTQVGELNIINFENSWMFMQTEVGYGYAIPLLTTKRSGSIVFTPQIGVGVYSGYRNATMMKPGGYWDAYDKGTDAKTRIMGYSVTPAARLEWRSQNEYFGVFAEGRRSIGYMNYGFMDGNIQHNMKYTSITLGFSTAIGKDTFRFLKRKKK